MSAWPLYPTVCNGVCNKLIEMLWYSVVLAYPLMNCQREDELIIAVNVAEMPAFSPFQSTQGIFLWKKLPP